MTEGRHHPVRGVLWMIAAAITFSITISLVRHLSETFSTFEILLFRLVFGVIVIFPWLLRSGLGSMKTDQSRIYAVRAVFTYCGMFAAYYSVTLITIADSIALQFTLPFFTIIFAMIFLHERVRSHRWLATVIGFLGALIIIRPGFAEVNIGMLIAIGAAASYGGSDICTRYLSGRDPVNLVVFYGMLSQIPIAIIPAAATWVTPGWDDAPMLILFCIAGFVAQICITRSFANAEATLVSPVLYIRLPFVAVLGFLFFDELPSDWTWVGAVVLFAATIYSTRRDAQIAKAAGA